MNNMQYVYSVSALAAEWIEITGIGALMKMLPGLRPRGGVD